MSTAALLLALHLERKFPYCLYIVQVGLAQLPLRNRASPMHFFVAKYRRNDLLLVTSITSETYDRQFFTHTANKLHDSTAARATPPLSFDVSFLENPCEYSHT